MTDPQPRPGSPDLPPARRVALVTGGNRGIGREVARQLAAAGFTVILSARDQGLGERAAATIDPGGRRVTARQLDVSDASSVAAAAAWARSELGVLDVLVNNAAIDYDTDQLATTADIDRVSRALDTNLLGAWRVSQAFLPLLRRSPHPRIVNVSSESGPSAR
jgi:NAD(P)-dependent dehydrogenase (short-subunit alcohol dehydrogenase family)